MFKNLTIGKKIGLGFGVVMMFLAATAVLSYSGVGGIVENASEVIAGGLRLALQCVFGCGHRLSLELYLVQVAHVSQLSGEQLDLEVAESQGEEIAGQLRIDRRGSCVQLLQGSRHDLMAVLQIANHASPRSVGLLEPVGRQEHLAAPGQHDQPAGRLLWWIVGTTPTGHLAGTA